MSPRRTNDGEPGVVPAPALTKSPAQPTSLLKGQGGAPDRGQGPRIPAVGMKRELLVYIGSAHFEHCLATLRTSPFFAGLDDSVLQEIVGLFRYETAVKKDTRVETEGPGQRFYVVLSGRAKVSAYNSATGREIILELLTTGDVFDIFSLLDGVARTVQVTALDDMEGMTTTLADVRGWIERHPGINRSLMSYVGAQMRNYAESIEDLTLFDTETRLARLILRHLASSMPTHGIHLINDLSQETLAAMIGSVRVVVAQHFQKWRSEGILTTGQRRWDVADPEGLIRKAEGMYRLRADGRVTRF